MVKIILIILLFATPSFALEYKVYDVDKRGDNRYDVYDIEDGKYYDVEMDKDGKGGTAYDSKEKKTRNFIIDDNIAIDVDSGDLYFIDD